MKKFAYIIKDELGIHARPAGLLVKTAKQYQSKITITKDEKSVDATKLIALMGMGVKQGTEISLQIEGPDEEQACGALKTFLEGNL